MKRESLLMFFAFALSSVLANTGTVTAELSADGTAFNVTFANHANETNSLWVVYGASDKGASTNGWEHVERLGTVFPETNSWTYATPSGWGDTVKAIRFILSEVPYDYDHSLDFIRSGTSGNAGGQQRICLDDFTMKGSYCVRMKMREFKHISGNLTLFSTRAGVGDVIPRFTLFWISGTNWRWDYGEKAGSNVSGAQANTFYEIAVSGKNGVVNLADNTVIATKNGASTLTDAELTGKLEFFCANNAAATMSNANGHMELYWAQVYDSPDADATLLVNLVPMVKNGRGGMYDTVRNKYYFSDAIADFDLTYGPSRLESAKPFFTSAICRVATTGPEVFTPATATIDALSCTNAYGGILNGTATLTLTGENDWGGAFTISNGTLVAAFGQGLASTDCLRMVLDKPTSGTLGGYGGWNGKATALIGSGVGQIYVPSNGYIAYCAADGDTLEVDIGGEGAAWTATSTLRRFLFNGASGAGTLTFVNPVLLPANVTLIVRTGFGKAIFAENIVSAVTNDTGATVSTYDLGNNNVADDGVTVFQGSDNRFKTLQVLSGTLLLGGGSSTTLDGNFFVEGGGKFIATNATVKMTGAAGYVSGLTVKSGSVEFHGGDFTASQIMIGETTTSFDSSAVFAGKITLSESLSANAYGSMTIHAGNNVGVPLTVNDGADVSMVNLNFYRRNIYQYGGDMVLRGNYGVNDMGQGGASRYVLRGGTLTAACVSQSSPTESTPEPKAWFVFAGGTLITRPNVKAVFFQNFSGDSSVQVAGSLGGTFQVDYNTSITNGLVDSDVNGNTWSYGPEDYLTAPAFRKTGGATLTLSGISTYRCATDVAAGTLALASGDAPGVLPTAGVLRLTGGTLDLGGNAQTMKALVGTAGTVQNGTITVTDGIYPGGYGAVGSFTCGAALAGTLHVDVDASSGACDKIIASGVLDLSGIDFVLPDEIPSGVTKLRVIEGATTGSFKSVTGMPAAWAVVASANGVSVKKVVGTMLSIR